MKNILGNSNFGFTKWCVALIAAGWMGATQINAQSFTGVYTFTGTTGNTSSFAYNGSAISGATISPLTQVNLTPSSSTGNMRSTGYPVGATSGSDVFTGSIDTTKYYQFSITADSGKTIDMTSLTFGIGRSATGTRQWQWRSSADNYSAPIPVVTLATGLTQSSGVITNPDSNSNWTGNVMQFSGASFIGLTSITFRVYSYNSESATGTAGLQGALTFSGTVNGTATTPAAPVVASASSISTTGFTANWAASSGATKYFLDVATDSGFSSFVGGFNNLDVGNVTSFSVTELTAGTTYYYRVRANNSVGNSPSSGVQTVATVAPTSPIVSVTGGTLTAFSTVSGQASEAQSFIVSGSNLTSDIAVTAPTGFELSTDAVSYSSSQTLSQVSGTVAATTISVRIEASTTSGTLASANVTIAATGVTAANVAVSGTVTTPALTLTLNPTSVAENAGATASTGTVGIPFSLANDLTVTLVSANTAAATVPASVTFTSGQTSVTFEIAAVANSNSYADVTSAITASATNYTSANATLAVTNVDAAPVSTISLSSLAADSYPQNFDALGTASITSVISSTPGVQTSLAAVTGSTTLNGWYATKIGGTGIPPTAITPDAGGGSSGLVYSYGAASASDRALGVLASGSNIMAIGALIKNDTGAAINSIKVSFTAEFWRSSTTTQNVLTCSVGKVDGTTITGNNFLTASSAIPLVGLNIVGPTPVATNGALDGNVAPNRATFSNVVLPVQLAPGETAFVRWSDANEAGNDAGLAIDDLSMTASLEAATSDGDGTVTMANNTAGSPYVLSGIWPRGVTGQGVALTVTPVLETTTLTSVSILVPTDFGAPVAGNVSSSGGAAGGTPAGSGQLLTITGVSITKANPGVINIAGLSTPDTATLGTGDGIYPFTVSTAGDGGTLKAVFASPSANVLIPISNVRDLDANWAPLDLGKKVAVEGVVTWSTGGGTYLQADGVGISALGVLNVNPLVTGNKYAILGTVAQSSGLTRLSPTSMATDVVNLGADVMPTPVTITLGKTAAEMEGLEGVLIKIENLNRAAGSSNAWGAATTISAVDGNSNPIDIRIQTDSSATSEPVYPVTVTGVLGQYDTTNPRNSGYQIMPRTAGDLSFAPGLKLVWSVAPAVILENGAGFDPSIIFLTVSRVGSSAGTAAVDVSISPTGRMLNNGSALPQTINFADGEISKVLSLTPVDDSVYMGDTVVTITATDTAGVLTVATAMAQILEDETSAPADTTAPVITLVGSAAITLDWASVYIEAGATATDNVDSSVTVNRSGSVNTSKPGVYVISFTASDAAGNNAIPVERTAIVSAPSSTPGADGVSGLLRYAFGANGPNDSVTKPTTLLTGGNLVLTAIIRVDNAKLTVAGEAVTDLVNYASGTAVTMVNGSSAGVDQTGVPAGCERQAFTVAQGGDLKKFLRLKITLAP